MEKLFGYIQHTNKSQRSQKILWECASGTHTHRTNRNSMVPKCQRAFDKRL
jgi:hypothetical protein